MELKLNIFVNFSEPTEASSLVIKQPQSEAVINKVVSIQRQRQHL